MDTWIITAITLAISTAFTTFIGLLVKRGFKKYVDKKDAEAKAREEEAKQQKIKEAELAKFHEEQQRQARKQDVLDSVREIVKPIVEKIEDLDDKMSKIEDGTLSTLRNDILTCYYRCVEKGYRNDYDYQNIHHMYDTYAGLHGNSYVEDIMKRFDALPVKEEVKEVSIGSTPKRKYTKKK